MTDIRQKALTLVNEVRSPFSARQIENLDDVMSWEAVDALCRAIEQHEAFRQDVSDALEKRGFYIDDRDLGRFIIAKPDPLVEALHGVYFSNYGPENVRLIRAAIEENGGKIVWGEG
jgi:hypothetical protein